MSITVKYVGNKVEGDGVERLVLEQGPDGTPTRFLELNGPALTVTKEEIEPFEDRYDLERVALKELSEEEKAAAKAEETAAPSPDAGGPAVNLGADGEPPSGQEKPLEQTTPGSSSSAKPGQQKGGGN